MKLLRALGFFVTSLLIFAAVPLLGWGPDDMRGFFSLAPRAAYAVLIVIMGVGAGVQAYDQPQTLRGGKGQADKINPRQTVVRIVITILLYVALFFLPFADRRHVGVMSEMVSVRWLGLALFGLGMILVFWSGIALGRLYSAEVTIQENHQLITSGPYRMIRHPRYLGGIVYATGFSLLFRSWIGLVGTALAVGIILYRIRDEEVLMHAEFGAVWETYTERSWRLIPYLY
ncbi:MAG: isoprenylcysteine carboxylmethyltransferase family protein [Ardenticatenaceae bacterium]|nr:isoprenylcysteine carboxylmethyltransferase family protein [Ardenticatenaceae bacterium]